MLVKLEGPQILAVSFHVKRHDRQTWENIREFFAIGDAPNNVDVLTGLDPLNEPGTKARGADQAQLTSGVGQAKLCVGGLGERRGACRSLFCAVEVRLGRCQYVA